jgi:3-hydroxyisobutyrate dehydrogenase-like beta-hydroxyacid dehydrogenase
MELTMGDTTPPAVGVVGLGHMGGAMAARFLEAGYRVYGTNRTPARAGDLRARGLHWCETPRAVAEATPIVLSSVSGDDALRTIARGPEGILAGMTERTVWVDMSTVSPRTSRELAEGVRDAGGEMLDAPVSGSVAAVRAGTLTIMVGGMPEAYQRVGSVLQQLGTPILVGENGQGLVLKLAINASLAVQMLALAEGLVLAERSGVAPGVALAVMTHSPIASPMMRTRARIVHDLPEEPWSEIRRLHEDVKLALSAGREAGVPLPTAERAREFLGVARELGYGGQDIAALVCVLDTLAGERDGSTPHPWNGCAA